MLAVVQQLDPAGVGARSVAECIAPAARAAGPRDARPDLALAHRARTTWNWSPASSTRRCCAALCAAPSEELEVALALVRGCHPRPGAAFSSRAAEYVVPDVFVRRSDHGWIVELNPATAAARAGQ